MRASRTERITEKNVASGYQPRRTVRKRDSRIQTRRKPYVVALYTEYQSLFGMRRPM